MPNNVPHEPHISAYNPSLSHVHRSQRTLQSTTSMETSGAKHVDLLILGAGWTSTFLIPLCIAREVKHAATSRPSAPKPDTLPFEFDESDEHPDPAQFAALPGARTVLITFPIKVKGASERLVRLYQQTHEGESPAFVQLGSSGIWEVCRPSECSCAFSTE
jgi:hypothetical protein